MANNEYDEHDPASWERAQHAGTALEHLQTFPSDALAAAARSDIDLNDLARATLAQRGLDWSGKWIGFPAAAQLLADWAIHRTIQRTTGGAR